MSAMCLPGTASLSGTSVRTRDAGRRLHTYYCVSLTKQMPRFREKLKTQVANAVQRNGGVRKQAT